MSNTLRFAVMGDMHYVRPEGHAEAFAGRPRGVTELVDLRRNLWFTHNVTPRVLTAIRALHPDFLVQTGDLIHGHCDDAAGNRQEMSEGLELISSVGVPLFFALGTHDGTLGRRDDEPIKELLLPLVGRSLGYTPQTGYYSFVRNNSLFVILDYATFAPGDNQHRFLQETLANASEYEHVFILAHPPVVPVGRPFFTAQGFAAAVMAEAAKQRIDAYFCGHTHNQVASIHKTGANWLPQLKSTVLAYPDAPPVFLDQVRPLLPPLKTYEYGWGFLEDSAPSWWLVTVAGDHVTADWHVLDRGVVGQLQWQQGSRARFTKLPDFVPEALTLPDLGAIRSMRLRAAGSNCRQPDGYAVSLNGNQLGCLPRLEYFDARQFLEIPRELWHVVREQNTLTVTTAAEDMCIGGFVLEIATDNGWTRSSLAATFYASCNRWDGWDVDCLEHIAPGQSITCQLTFSTPAQQVG